MRTYQATDKFLAKLKKREKREFVYYSLLSFSEFSTMKKTSAEIQKLIDRLEVYNESSFDIVAGEAIREATELLTPGERQKFLIAKRRAKKKIFEEQIVEETLLAFNPVTEYLYAKEINRKKGRLIEGILTTKEFNNHAEYLKILQHFFDLWYTQSKEYSESIEDKADIFVFRKAGIQYVKWVTQKDEKVCEYCASMDDQIFPIDEAPHKTHYNCRCVLEPYRRENS